ncbi:hypothetical protein HanHA300_Chr12g0457621 [Helianthus annuus]|nr:hypothetical protein HanHA300_Chr12g0457621 [Helianthus annuus]KAJ0494886.1 hypothetical protein HanIR_Chr12g0602581 [Helianthus annuus]KAJ0506542.1 hypothetical protein HanHA89_Chr12g0483201 [Helianthus annuus]KAJ0676218.1 hypothetical protein HanLR1_Chr12g0460181 [Helianthus annuus]KAJ0679445.1 hypothetical protein HanOQP8_Chr12g0459531 [Helianthus annuus]
MQLGVWKGLPLLKQFPCCEKHCGYGYCTHNFVLTTISLAKCLTKPSIYIPIKIQKVPWLLLLKKRRRCLICGKYANQKVKGASSMDSQTIDHIIDSQTVDHMKSVVNAMAPIIIQQHIPNANLSLVLSSFFGS